MMQYLAAAPSQRVNCSRLICAPTVLLTDEWVPWLIASAAAAATQAAHVVEQTMTYTYLYTVEVV